MIVDTLIQIGNLKTFFIEQFTRWIPLPQGVVTSLSCANYISVHEWTISELKLLVATSQLLIREKLSRLAKFLRELSMYA